MEAAPFDSECFQNRVQASAQDVALAERLSFARAEDVSILALPDEVEKQLRNVRVEVNDAIGDLRLRCPTREFMDSLDDKAGARIDAFIERSRVYGNRMWNKFGLK